LIRLNIEATDFSAFSWRDAADIALQRTSTLISLPVLKSPSYRAWTFGRSEILFTEAFLRRRRIIRLAFEEIRNEFLKIREFIGKRQIKSVLDIGCGHGILDLMFCKEYGCDIHLVDIESTKPKHHEFRNFGSGYSSLHKAKQFLTANGISENRISCTNPQKGVLADAPIDLVISLLSCGFHYPLSQYLPFVRRNLKPGGMFIFDMRNGTNQEDTINQFTECFEIDVRHKSRRIALVV
jgi:SAM-dependent methyltransferase